MHFLKKMRYVPLLVAPFICLVGAATTYYLNTNAQSSGKGTSRTGAYNNVASINTHAPFSPGDSILIACGTTVKTANPATPQNLLSYKRYMGVLVPQGSGVGGRPITIDTFIDNNNFSTVKPVIDAQGRDSTACIFLYNDSDWTIKDMEIKSTFKIPNTSGGLYPSLSDSFNAQGYRWGILVDFDNYPSSAPITYKNISIINNTVDSVYGSYCTPTVFK